MVATKISINWTSYSPVFPDVISLQLFDDCKCSKQNLFIQSKFLFFRIFRLKVVILCLAIIIMLGHKCNMFPRAGWKSELLIILEVPFFIIASFQTINLVFSSISYVSSYIESKNYEMNLSKLLFKNKTYEKFCVEMSGFDKRYIMQIQRIMKQE